MIGMGRVLREEREARGITVAEMHRRTHIREWIIEAIEAENYRAIPGGTTYLKGFVRRLYAELNLDCGALSRGADPLVKGDVPPVTKKRAMWQPSLTSLAGMALMLVAIIASAAYWFLWLPRPQILPPVVTPPEALEPPAVQPPPSAVPPVERPAFVLVSEARGTLVYAVEKWPMELVVSVREEQCWVMVNVDGQGERATTVRAGQTKTVTASTSLHMRLGRARVVDISVNGRLLPGQEGDVKDFTFKRAGP
ncbi:MAG: hypothetical protein DDT34_00115 [Firmicutes bacterium]|nr:hypothetical protein [Bacillota bacterium]